MCSLRQPDKWKWRMSEQSGRKRLTVLPLANHQKHIIMDIVIDKQTEARVKAYLDEFASKDPVFAEKYRNPAKSITDACKYMVKAAYDRLTKRTNTAVTMTDEEGFGLAVHYYDEPELGKVEIKGAGKAATSVAPVKKPDTAPTLFSAPTVPQRKPHKRGSRKTDESQLSLF